MAVLKSKAYNTQKAIENALNYIEDSDKTGMQDWERFIGAQSSDALLENALAYSSNPQKTTLRSDGLSASRGENATFAFSHMGDRVSYAASSDALETLPMLVSGYRCRLDLAKETFDRTRMTYYKNGHQESVGHHYQVRTLLRPLRDKNGDPILDAAGNMIHDETEKSPVYRDADGNPVEFMQDRVTRARVCYMWVMSFAPASVTGFEIDPRLAHQIGLEFCAGLEEITGLTFPFVVATHTDKEHIHNHIMQSAYSFDGHHKYRDTMDMLQAMRDLSDRLSLKYNLPIIVEPENAHSMNYSEWKLTKEGKCWKDKMRQDITYALEHSDTYEEYLRRMKLLGYTLRETSGSITYYSPGKEHRCRDVGLGSGYTKADILHFYDIATFAPENNSDGQSLQGADATLSETVEFIDPAAAAQKKRTYRVYVSRYTASGRRRSDLEMLLLKAIKILKLLRSFLTQDTAVQHPKQGSPDWKIARLQETISVLNSQGIGTMEELNGQLKTIGANLSHARKEAATLSVSETVLQSLKDSIEEFLDLQSVADGLGITTLYLPAYTAGQIAAEQARLFPMTSAQRRELYLALQSHPEYRVPKYNLISYHEANAVLDYLSGKTTVKPPALMTPDEWENYRLDPRTLTTAPDMDNEEWDNSLWQLSYEQRQTMTEYREIAHKLSLAGYDIADLDRELASINEQLSRIEAAKQSVKELAAEYKTLIRTRRFVKLASDPTFLKGMDRGDAVEQKKNEIPSKHPNDNQPATEKEAENQPKPTEKKDAKKKGMDI